MRTILFFAFALLSGGAAIAAPASPPWQSIGPWGGAAEVVRTSSLDRDHVVVATRGGAIFTSSDAGGSWREVSFPARGTGVLHALEIDPRSGATWYAGMEGHTTRTSGVYRTADGGGTWTLLEDTRGLDVWSLAFAPSNADIIAVGTGSGIFASDDRGEHFSRMSPADHRELRPVVSLAFDPRDSRILFAGTTRLPWRTEDGGRTWRAVTTGMLDDSDVFSIVVDPARPGRVLASACSGAYVSTDAGGRWTRLPTPAGAFRVHVVAIDPDASDTVFAGTSAGLFRSTDGGATWRRVSASVVKSIAFDRFAPGRVFFGSDAGVLRSTDRGVTARAANIGFASQTFTDLAASGNALLLTGPRAQYRTDQFAQQWAAVAGARPRAGSLSAGESASWKDCAAPVTGATWYALAADTALSQSQRQPQRSTMLAATSRGLFRSTDGCRSWTAAVDGLEQATASTVLFHPTRGGEAFVAQGGRVFRSTDAGASWHPLGDARDLWPSHLAILAAAPDRLFALVPGRGVFSLGM